MGSNFPKCQIRQQKLYHHAETTNEGFNNLEKEKNQTLNH